MSEKLRGFVVGLIVGGFFVLVICLFIPLIPAPANDNTYTTCFQILDKSVIKNSGSTEIDSIVSNLSINHNETQKLNEIADAITNNFSDGYWTKNDSWQYIDNSQIYSYNEKGQIYIRTTKNSDSIRDLAIDPNWIIYYHAGACRELSILFDTISTKAGFKTRLIRTGNGDSEGFGATHWWNEVEINGINKTFDVQWFGLIKNGSSGTSWSGNRSDYYQNSDGFSPNQLCSWGGVWITDAQGHKIEDVTQDYVGTYKC